MALSCVVLLIMAGAAWGQMDCKHVLFSGELRGATLGCWGSGTAEVDEEETYLEGSAVRVETTGFFEGGRIDLTTPLAADQFFADPAGGYLRLVVKVNEPAPTMPGGAPGGMVPGAFPGEPGMMPGEPWMMPGEPGMVPGAQGCRRAGYIPGLSRQAPGCSSRHARDDDPRREMVGGPVSPSRSANCALVVPTRAGWSSPSLLALVEVAILGGVAALSVLGTLAPNARW